jgi:hypothetical protein
MEDLIDAVQGTGHDELGSRSGISSVPLKPDEWNALRSTVNRLMEYTVMPFGATCPSSFLQFMNTVLKRVY